MATVNMQSAVPSHMRAVPGSVNIPVARFPSTAKPGNTIDPASIASEVVSTFNQALKNSEYGLLSHLFTEAGYWRDHLAVTWVFRTIQSPPHILSFLQTSAGSKDGLRLKKIAVDSSSAVRAPRIKTFDNAEDVSGIHFFIRIETALGRGNGLIRLVEQGGVWKIFTLYTSLEELHGFEEPVNARRPKGVEHGGKPGRKNWAERRELEADFVGESGPAVLVIGMSGTKGKDFF